MATERTLSIIKPDATKRNLTGAINAVFEKAGLRIVAQKRVRLTRAQAEGFYGEHKARGFFGELVDVRDFDGLKAVLPKGAQVARASGERSFGAAQEVFANTIKTNEAIGALAKGQFETVTAQAKAEVEKVTKAAKAK